MNTGRSFEILIVDDDAGARSMVRDTLSSQGHILHEAERGDLARSYCEQHMPDLILLDIMMPRMDGNEACKRIRALPGGEAVCILMLTARESVEDIVESLSQGANDYLRKPFHYRELLARVDALLRVRELYLALDERNQKLQKLQAELVQKERQLLATQLGGGAAHELGQPLAALTLQLHLLETLPKEDERFHIAINAAKKDAERMGQIIDRLRQVDANKTEQYHEETEVLSLTGDEKGKKEG